MTYADKYDKTRYSIYRFYREIRRKVDVNVQIGRLYPNVLDHVVLDDDDVDDMIIEEVAQSHPVDDAAASIQRFASRCLAADKSEMMVDALSNVYGAEIPLRKPIIDVISFYGAKLDPNDRNFYYTACFVGMNDIIKQAIENGNSVDSLCFHAAVVSGNCDTIRLVFSAYRGSVSALSVENVHLLNATVQSMELLLSLNIIQHGKHCKFYSIPSFSVLQWILDHDVMEHDDVLIDIASFAAYDGGHYFDMLRYLIEQRNFTVPRDVLISINCTGVSDLDVLDYLLLHGADVNDVDHFGRNVLERSPMLVRYWLDNGLIVKTNSVNAVMNYIAHGMTAPVLEMMIDKYELNVNDVDRYGYTALHMACRLNNYKLVEMLLRHGANAKALDFGNRTQFYWVIDERIKQLLIEYGCRI